MVPEVMQADRQHAGPFAGGDEDICNRVRIVGTQASRVWREHLGRRSQDNATLPRPLGTAPVVVPQELLGTRADRDPSDPTGLGPFLLKASWHRDDEPDWPAATSPL